MTRRCTADVFTRHFTSGHKVMRLFRTTKAAVRSVNRASYCGAVPAVPARRWLSTTSSHPALHRVPTSRHESSTAHLTTTTAAGAAPDTTSPRWFVASAAAATVPVQADGRQPFIARPHLSNTAGSGGGGGKAGTAPSYDHMYSHFKWPIPEYYNIGVDVCDKHVAAGYGNETAMIYASDDMSGGAKTYTWNDIKRLSNQFANALIKRGVKRGDRFGILLPQCPETAIAHVALYKAGAIAIPIFTLFGPDGIEFRLKDSGACGVITDDAGLANVQSVRHALKELKHLIYVAEAGNEQFDSKTSQIETTKGPVTHFYDITRTESKDFTPVNTRAEDPALIIYTSGTTGNPKGCLHAHRVLLGHLPGVELPHNFFPQPNDLFWTPADWAWIGGLMDALMPAWHHRHPVLAHRSKKFDAHEAFALMKKYKVRNTFMPPTALKLMRQAIGNSATCPLRSVGSGGETLGSEVLEWGRQAFGCEINEFFGQTECNLVVSNSYTVFPIRPQSMGRIVPGHRLAILDAKGTKLGPNDEGNIAIRSPDPTMFLRYWNNTKATAEKFLSVRPPGGGEEEKWLIMGDQGWYDADGYFYFKGRDDDIICSASYRIGPGEIENSLLKHPAVSMSAVIGKPDATRTEIVKAFVVLRAGFEPSDELANSIREFVKNMLAKHEYPREVEFVTSLPMTTTGKIQRKQLKIMEIQRAALAAVKKPKAKA